MNNQASASSDIQKAELELVSRCQNGDSTAFAQLYDNYAKRVYQFVYYRTGHKETAEDLTSITFTKAFQNIQSFKGSQGVFGAWLFKIARNNIIDNMRTRKQTVDLDAAEHVASKTNIAGEFDYKNRVDQVKEYLDQLDEVQRDIVIMRLWDDMPYTEIAAIVGKSEGNCKVIFSRVLQKMKTELVSIISLIASVFIIQ